MNFKRKTINASRISEDNKLFPPSITIGEEGFDIKFPGLFSDEETFVNYNDISSISIDCPLIGFSKIILNIKGQIITVDGFYKSDANLVKNAWKKNHK